MCVWELQGVCGSYRGVCGSYRVCGNTGWVCAHGKAVVVTCRAVEKSWAGTTPRKSWLHPVFCYSEDGGSCWRLFSRGEMSRLKTTSMPRAL